VDSFRQGLRDLGWIEGKSISIEYQFGDGQLSLLGELAAELVRRNVDVIVTVPIVKASDFQIQASA
jgi:putative tryptophan/tyrosine transport system substrate-binding protein